MSYFSMESMSHTKAIFMKYNRILVYKLKLKQNIINIWKYSWLITFILVTMTTETIVFSGDTLFHLGIVIYKIYYYNKWKCFILKGFEYILLVQIDTFLCMIQTYIDYHDNTIFQAIKLKLIQTVGMTHINKWTKRGIFHHNIFYLTGNVIW